MSTIKAIAAAALLAASAPSAFAEVHTGQTMFANVKTLACPTDEAFSKYYQLVKEGDSEAATKSAVRDGCIVIEQGAAGKLTKPSAIDSGGVCIRWKGQPDCMWSPVESIVHF
jgi:hypothetical protein